MNAQVLPFATEPVPPAPERPTAPPPVAPPPVAPRPAATPESALLTADELVRRLGIPRASLDLWRLNHKVLALDPGTGRAFGYPAFQCDLLGRPARRQAFEKVLQALSAVPPSAQLRFLTEPSAALGGQRPWMALLGGDPAAIESVARAWCALPSTDG